MSKGELTVECPACLHPRQNLPDGWERARALLYVFSPCFPYIYVDQSFMQVLIYTLSCCRW